MVCAAGIQEMAHDPTARIDAGGLGACGSRHIDGCEGVPPYHKAMVCAAGIQEMAHDLAARIDPGGLGVCGARHIDGDEGGPP